MLCVGKFCKASVSGRASPLLEVHKINNKKMEKTHLEVNFNGKSQDCVISHFMQAQKDENNKVIWTRPNDYIAKVKGAVHEITVYVKDDNDYNKVSVVKLSAFAVKSLYAHIIEIESKQGEEFVEP